MTDHEQDRRRIRRALRAPVFRPSPELERIEKDPALLDRLSPSAAAALRLQLAYYRRDRAAANDEEYDDDDQAA